MSTLCRAGRRWRKYGRAEKSAPKAFGVLPGLSFCHPSARQACRAIAVAATAGRTASQSVAVICKGRHGWPAQFDPVRPKKINPKVWAVSEKSPGCRNRFRMWSNRDRFVAPSCPHSPRRRGKPLRQRRVKPRSGLDRVSPHRNLSANTVK